MNYNEGPVRKRDAFDMEILDLLREVEHMCDPARTDLLSIKLEKQLDQSLDELEKVLKQEKRE